MKQFFDWLLFNNIIVSVGAVITGLAVAKKVNHDSGIVEFLILGIVVWVIYTADRIIDVFNIEDKSILEGRHAYHWRNHSRLILIVVILSLLAFTLSLLVAKSVLSNGFVLFMVVAAYFLLINLSDTFSKYFKELTISFVFSIGFFAPTGFTMIEVLSSHYSVWLQLFLLCIINLLLFSMRDKHYDLNLGVSSIVSQLSLKALYVFVGFSSVSFTALILIDYTSNGFEIFSVIMVAMFLNLMSLWVFDKKIHQDWIFRAIGDGIFLLPIVYLFN